MIKDISTNQMIRNAQENLGITSSNRDIKAWCQENYNIRPLSQAIYACLGSESERIAETFTAKEVSDGKKFIRNKFNGDYDRAYQAIRLIGSF